MAGVTRISQLVTLASVTLTDVLPIVSRSSGALATYQVPVSTLLSPGGESVVKTVNGLPGPAVQIGDLTTVQDYATVAEAIAYAVSAGTMVGSTEDLTINVPSDCATLQIALDRIYALAPDVSITLNIEAGHAPAVGVSLSGSDYGAFTITSDAAIVTVDSSFPTSASFVFGENTRLPTLGTVVDMNGRGYTGYYARLNSRGYILPGCGIKNLGQLGAFGISSPGVFANINSSIHGFEAVITGNPRNVWISRASNFDGEGGTYTSATGDHAFYASRNCNLHIPASDIRYAANEAVVLRRSKAVLDACDLSEAGTTGLTVELASQGSMVSRGGVLPKVNNCGVDGIVVQQGSTFNFQDGEITGNVRDGISLEQSTLFAAVSAVVTGNGRYGATSRGSSGLTLNDSVVTSNVTNIFVAEGGIITLANTDIGSGVRTETANGSRYRETLEVYPGVSTGYGRFIVETSTGDQGGMEYSTTDAEVRFVTANTRKLRILDNGRVRPEVDDNYQLGAADRRWSNTYSDRFSPGPGNVFITAGTATPEGVVAARVGSVYLRENGTALSALYVKVSGATSTGWSAFQGTFPGPFADDAAASVGGVSTGQAYYRTADNVVVVKVT